jgi:mannose-6-phosphate isomerase
MLARLEPAAVALVDWAIDAALPLWATAGFDPEHGRFEERLTLGGGRLPDVPLRLMSQARQIHAYALAARRGWHPGALALAERAYASMVRDYHGRDDRAGWVFSVRRDGAVADARRDLYTHAFVLLAIASYVQATGRRDALALADQTLAFVDRHMAAPTGGGFVEELPSNGGLRRQNPHMHLFEALLALWECSHQERFLARATELFDLFATRFFRDPGILGEYFTADLEPADGVVGRIVEPGHHHEWVWLLRRFEEASARSVQAYVNALYGHADRHGFDEAGMIIGELLVDGTPRAGTRRIWPVTEAIRTNLVEARRGRMQGEGRAAALAVVLRDRFLTVDPPGGWLDRLDDKGRCVSEYMPASTLYHLLGAIDELSRFVGWQG